jgi:membrane protease YdiL (CAAX protease family)
MVKRPCGHGLLLLVCLILASCPWFSAKAVADEPEAAADSEITSSSFAAPYIIAATLSLGGLLWIAYAILRTLGIRIFDEKPYEPVRWSLSSALLVLATFVTLNVVLSLIIIQVAPELDAFSALFRDPVSMPAGYFFATLLALTGTIILVFLHLRHFDESPRKVGITLNRPARHLLIGVAAGLMVYPLFLLSAALVSYVAEILNKEIPTQEPMRIFFLFRERGGILLYLYVLFVSIIGPAGEELIFRGFFQNALRRYVPAPAAVIGSGLLFALLHLNVYSMLPIFCLGVFLGYVFEKTRSLIAPIALHALHNSLILAMAFLTPHAGDPAGLL